jgi:hypothetical protein
MRIHSATVTRVMPRATCGHASRCHPDVPHDACDSEPQATGLICTKLRGPLIVMAQRALSKLPDKREPLSVASAPAFTRVAGARDDTQNYLNLSSLGRTLVVLFQYETCQTHSRPLRLRTRLTAC